MLFELLFFFFFVCCRLFDVSTVTNLEYCKRGKICCAHKLKTMVECTDGCTFASIDLFNETVVDVMVGDWNESVFEALLEKCYIFS